MIVRCPLSEYAQVNALVCVYRCEKKVKVKCEVYNKNYEAISTLDIEDKYLLKYGSPSFPTPKAREPKKVRKKRTAKLGKPVPRKKKVEEDKPVAVPAKPDPKVADKPKRKRRTKAEMEEARRREGGK